MQALTWTRVAWSISDDNNIDTTSASTRAVSLILTGGYMNTERIYSEQK